MQKRVWEFKQWKEDDGEEPLLMYKDSFKDPSNPNSTNLPSDIEEFNNCYSVLDAVDKSKLEILVSENKKDWNEVNYKCVHLNQIILRDKIRGLYKHF